MTFNLIGLIRASRNGAAPDQGFKNYVAQAGTGVRMTDYIMGEPLVLQSISGVTQRVGTLTKVSSSYETTNTPIPPFTTVTLVASFQAGAKAQYIWDQFYVDGDGANQVLVGTIQTDGPAIDTAFQYVQTRSVSVDFTLQRITAVLQFNTTFSSSASNPAPGDPAAGYVYVPFRLAMAPEPYFNLRAYTGPANDITGFNQVAVRPMKTGQPSPTYMPQPFVIAPAEGTFSAQNVPQDWEELDGAFPRRIRFGDEIFEYQSVVGPTTHRYILVGYRVRGQYPSPNWYGDFTAAYQPYGLQISYAWQQQQPDASWATVETDTVGAATQELSVGTTFVHYRAYGAPGSSLTLRIQAQVTAPFTQVIGTTAGTPYTFFIDPDRDVFVSSTTGAPIGFTDQ